MRKRQMITLFNEILNGDYCNNVVQYCPLRCLLLDLFNFVNRCSDSNDDVIAAKPT